MPQSDSQSSITGKPISITLDHQPVFSICAKCPKYPCGKCKYTCKAFASEVSKDYDPGIQVSPDLGCPDHE